MEMLNKQESAKYDKAAIDPVALSTNYGDIARDCLGMENASFANEMQNNFPLANWLLSTSMSQRMRSMAENGLINKYKEEGTWYLRIPNTMWTLPPENNVDECCWTLPDFDKCASKVPLKLLCLKDCDNIEDIIIGQNTRLTSRDAVAPIAYSGDTLNEVNDRIARLMMAFYTAHTLIQGTLDVTTNLTKPFSGMVEIMSNPAIWTTSGASILAAFDELGCRLSQLGTNGVIFAAHPLIMESVRAAIAPDQYNRRPEGWTVDSDGTIRFKGIRFISDKLMPYSTTTATGDIYMLSGEAMGAYLVTDLIPADAYRRYGWSFDEDNCGTECRFYYNEGAVFANNANKLAVITGVPATDACINATSDLAGLIVPNTLIPRG